MGTAAREVATRYQRHPTTDARVATRIEPLRKGSPMNYTTSVPNPTCRPAILRSGLCTLLLTIALAASAATVTRGPYLQMGTPNSIVVRAHLQVRAARDRGG